MMAKKSSLPDWVFDNSPIPDPLGHGERAVQFLRALRHIKSTAAGRDFTIYPWQERIIRAIYGPRDANGDRIVPRVSEAAQFLVNTDQRQPFTARATSVEHQQPV